MKPPVNKDGWERYKAKLREDHPTHRIDFLFAMELEIALVYYHGGRIRFVWEMIRKGIYLGTRGFYWTCIYRLCDKVGWTRLQPIPGTPYFERHSSKCDKMNCADCECVENGIPKWFQKLARIQR